MSRNPYNAFIAYLVNTARSTESFEAFESVDPSGGQWMTLGLVPPFAGEPLKLDLQGAAALMTVQFNERILPGKVRDEALRKLAAKLEGQQGRKVSKKEYAELRDQVEFDLLPRAFIRRTRVPVFFFKGRVLGEQTMLVCTGSQRRADSVVALLASIFSEDFKAWRIETQQPVGRVLTDLAENGSHESERFQFFTQKSVVLRGEEKRTIRVKDKDIADSDIQQFLREAYSAIEIALAFDDGLPTHDDPLVDFKVTDSMIFKGIKLPNVREEAKDDFAFAVIFVQTMKNMLTEFVEMCGGYADRKADDEEL